VAAFVLWVSAAGCGVPNDQNAHSVEIGNFVEDVERLSLAAQAPGDTGEGARISVYMINTAELSLVPVTRTAPYYSLEQIMKQLFFGPTGSETNEGIRSSISSRTRVREVDISNGEAKIDVSSPLTDSGGFEVVLALAQIVMTASQVRGVESVRLFLDGTQVLDAPRQDGTSTSEPLTREDYEQLLTK
jgi:spore germination protein GerM